MTWKRSQVVVESIKVLYLTFINMVVWRCAAPMRNSISRICTQENNKELMRNQQISVLEIEQTEAGGQAEELRRRGITDYADNR